jgi:hypothetical protein
MTLLSTAALAEIAAAVMGTANAVLIPLAIASVYRHIRRTKG